MSGFQHDIAGGAGNLIITSVQSPNYSTGVSGWQIRQDGSAEFNNLVIRGTFNGTDFIINNNGAFFYSGTPAAGNLIVSLAGVAGTDAFGNAYVQGVGVYLTLGGSKYAIQLGAQTISGTSYAGVFVQSQTSAPSLPAFAGGISSAAGSQYTITSGKGTAGADPADIIMKDSLSHPGGSIIELVADAISLNGSELNIPQSLSGSIISLPPDGNSGSTWVSGERAFMNNNWVANINSNFSVIVAALNAAGITV